MPISSPGNHYWLDPASGQVLRSKPRTIRAESTTFPVIANGKLYYGAFVMDAASATPLCAHPERAGNLNPGSIYYDLPLSDNVLYISTDSSVVAFDTLACQPKWEYRPQGRLGLNRLEIVSNPAILGEVVYAIFSDGTLRAVNRQSGLEVGYWQATTVKYSFTDNSAIPGVAVSNDTLVASFGNGQIYAFGP
jgi:outer membrane protein assembly factor BamB